MDTIEHGTIPYNEKMAQYQRETVPGMAHWAGSGPDGKTCRECANCLSSGYYAKRGMGGGNLKPIGCSKFAALLQTKPIKFPHEKRACRFFEQSAAPPSITRGE